MADYKGPLPQPNLDDKPFWEGCKRHELLLQKCTNCGKIRPYNQPMCGNCNSLASEPLKASGKGEVWSYSTTYHAFGPTWEGRVPYTVGVIKLAEGPRLTSNIVGCDPKDISIGMPVEVTFEDVTPEVTLPKFKPAK